MSERDQQQAADIWHSRERWEPVQAIATALAAARAEEAARWQAKIEALAVEAPSRYVGGDRVAANLRALLGGEQR